MWWEGERKRVEGREWKEERRQNMRWEIGTSTSREKRMSQRWRTVSQKRTRREKKRGGERKKKKKKKRDEGKKTEIKDEEKRFEK